MAAPDPSEVKLEVAMESRASNDSRSFPSVERSEKLPKRTKRFSALLNTIKKRAGW